MNLCASLSFDPYMTLWDDGSVSASKCYDLKEFKEKSSTWSLDQKICKASLETFT